jgi:hypothetical protein
MLSDMIWIQSKWGLRIKPKLLKSADEQWDFVCNSDSDYACDPDTRRSVSGFILYVKDVPAYAGGQRLKEALLRPAVKLSGNMFVLQLLKSMHIQVELPITVRVDNIGAIRMSQNVNTSSRTKNVDIPTKYVNEYFEDGVLKIIFVKSADNDSDIMTKNLGGDLHSKRSNKLIKTKPK